MFSSSKKHKNLDLVFEEVEDDPVVEFKDLAPPVLQDEQSAHKSLSPFSKHEVLQE